ncbi:fanconi anemia group M protein [Haloarcula vallismortis]|uniref:Hef nuclease n=2 Tax=Haloarcula vallismortis TaxID=28442 RepID=M0J5T3_HALVA|nr:DEAD/DEAH box helicase [Haloarcula vallismortis]EMA03713.1 Hef nuclease [Haloarcula vallismortis ATCC 29715]SDW33644.1 fanconi anemia group M protein [Haloarcula vallismortis]
MATTDAGGEYVERPLVTPEFLENRRYQTELAETASADHTLVCLPTGLGKTTVSLLVTAERLDAVGGKALMLAPTKPLVQQHAEFYREALEIDDEDVVVFTGEVRPDDRAALWEDARIVIATPQVVENDLVGNRISLAEVTHCTFDECHRATGDYAYNYIADRYHADAADPLVTGMSASPGDDEEAILEVCENLGLAEVAVMTEDDADVTEYTHDTSVDWNRIELPEIVVEIRDAINEVIEDRLDQLRELGVTNKSSADISEREIQQMQGKLRDLMNNDQSEGYQGMSLLAEIRKLRTAVTYVETQSVESLRRYFERLKEAARSSGASKADQRLVSEPKVREAIRKANSYDDLHPKFRQTRMLLAETLGIENGERVIVFTESRDTAETLVDFLSDHFTTQKFVGQSDTDGSEGMTQTQQQETLDRFRNGEFEVLVSTSVAEEGLDVPEVDLVLFYEPVPTAIRAIQRKGRTGRQAEGRVVVLLAEDTRDEAYFWKARNDQKRMKRELNELKSVAGELEARLDQTGLDEYEDESGGGDGPDAEGVASGGTKRDETATQQSSSTGNERASTANKSNDENDDGDGQAGLDAFAEASSEATDGDERTGEEESSGTVATAGRDDEDDPVEIVADQRELDSNIARDLSTRDGIETRLETLAVGDYILSDRVVVERKTVADFMDTLTGGDRSMFEQVGDATRNYGRPVVVIEGEDLFGARNVHHKAIQGALASLAVDFGASVLRTSDEDETADLLEVIAGREQEVADREVSVHGEKQSKTLPEQQEYVVASIAEVGPVTARTLLNAFGSVEAVMTADKEDLLEVSGIGDVTADRIREVIASDYAP